ncbi:MAG: SAM-dependent methyltransferase [Bdellovibrionales bacterium]
MNALEKIIREIIAAQGAISMAAYMELALQHPAYGYYKTREPLGKTGDFITAPEVSQMFGEMIGVWCVETWRKMGRPEPFALVEYGPGHGTMMQDILRATAKAGGFNEAKQLCLIDSDEILRERQKEVLKDSSPQHIVGIAHAPSSPLFVLSNEFLDAMPVRQFEKTHYGWAERMVAIENDALTIVLRPLTEAEDNYIPAAMRGAAPNTVFEFSPKAQVLIRDIVQALISRQGAALMCDYGYVLPSGSSTVQAVSRHRSVNIFERPGEVDLTAHVDFSALAEVARECGAKEATVVSQGEFLRDCGIEIRADALKKHATEDQAMEIDSGLHRLIDDEQMGNLFKVLEIKCFGD